MPIHRAIIAGLLIPFITFCDDATLLPASHHETFLAKTPKTTTHNGQTIDQKVIITQPKKDPTDCTQLQGKAMLACMECQSSENLKKNIINFNDRMAHYYFLNLSLEEYGEALQNFTEPEWHNFYESRSPDMRENFPKTLEEQREMLKLIYFQACYNDWDNPYNYLEYLWSGKEKFKKDTTEKIIADYTDRCLNGSIYPCTINRMYHKFYLMRKKLFTKS